MSKDGNEFMSLEEQVMDLNFRLQEQEKLLRQKDKKSNKKRQKSNGRDSYITAENCRKSLNLKSVERVGGYNQLNSSVYQGGSKLNDAMSDLNKALDRIFELEERNQDLEKERTVLSLDLK